MTTTARLAAPYVRSQTGVVQNALVLAPAPATLEAAAPLHGEAHTIASRAAEQFAIFEGRLAAFGIECARVEAVDSATLGSSCVDGAVMFDDGAFLMRSSDPARRGDAALLEATLASLGIPIVGRIEAPGLLDGGDVLVGRDRAFIGHSQARRSEFGIRAAASHGNELGREQFAAYARTRGLTIVAVALAAEVTRLRAVASFVDDETVLYAPGVLDAAAFSGIASIEVPRGEDYAAGVFTLGKRRVLANLRFRETIPMLRKAKIAVDAIDLGEFGKLGLGPSLLALPLRRG